ncbi:MAG: sigma-54-dependent Fis family transcriptional regulator [Victivallales bacterium]|nr:sigma-54-dependent Fis family transcriptional regulator [Victivallales bacterium]
MQTILVIDDEESICYALRRYLEKRGYRVETAANGAGALPWCGKAQLAFLDVRLGQEDGLALLAQMRERNPQLAVVVMTAYGTLETVSRAMALGAFDYVTKPLDMKRAEELVCRALAGNADQTQGEEAPHAENGFVGSSPKMQELFKNLLRYAGMDAPVLITGETGTGKELAARLIHSKSRRSQAPFVAVNCGALPENLVESELFGHRRGTFTGAEQDKRGLCAAAHSGILFLDEVGELPLPAQVKLLRFLDSGQFWPLGASEPMSVDVRVIAATNRDLKEAVEQGGFRADLFYRLAVLQIHTPALREHAEDIPELARYFLAQVNGRLQLDDPAIRELTRRQWRGNVRELRNAIWQAATTSQGALVSVANLPKGKAETGGDALQQYVNSLSLDGQAMERAVRELQTRLIRRALDECGGNQTLAAERLGLHRNSLHRLATAPQGASPENTQ